MVLNYCFICKYHHLCTALQFISVLVSEEIKEYFGQFGQVKKCLLVFVSILLLLLILKSHYGCVCDIFMAYFYYQDKDTGFHRGFCWIGYSSEEGLQNALQKDPHIMEGSRVRNLRINHKTFPVNCIEVQYQTKKQHLINLLF